MTSLSFEESLARFAGTIFIAADVDPKASAATAEDMDPEERRWQLEWSRRTIED
jgi:hypothetical protein